MSRPIHFGGQRWSAEPDPFHEQKAKNPKIPASLRIVEAAKARANLYGHAAFQSRQLQQWLSGKDGKLAAKSTISRAIHAAVEWGYLAPVSTSRCLVLVREGWTRGYGRMSACHEPAHDGHRCHEWLRDSGWGIWQPPVNLSRARDAEKVEAVGALYYDPSTGQVVNTETGEALDVEGLQVPQPEVADSATLLRVEFGA
jgi:hypothetical protein